MQRSQFQFMTSKSTNTNFYFELNATHHSYIQYDYLAMQIFSELTNVELYKILQLRNEVFVVEQNCAYQDCDDKDFKAYHFTGLG